ncbi:MAG: tail fiber domain-containing protein [Lachnospiraceae bacterium]
MFIASQDFITKQKGFSRTFHAKLVVGSTEIIEGILSLKYEGCVNEEDTLTLGSTVSNRVEVSIMNLSIPIEGKEFTAYVGLDINGTVEYIPLGIFTAQKPEKGDSLYTFTAFDRMMKTEKAYFSSLSENTTTVAALNEICSKLGFTLATTLKAISIKKIEGLTYREAISYIAQLHGGYATFNRQGQLEIRYFKDVSYTVKVDRYFDDLVVQENNFIVNAISCATNEENTLTAGTGVASIAISNPYMTQSTLDSIYNTLKGFTYRPASFSMLGDILLDPGDIITMQAKDGNVYKIPIMSITQEFDGGLTTTIEAVGKTEEELDLDYKGPSTKTMERYVIELALINKVVANKVDAEYVEAEFIKVNNTISAVTGEFQTIKGNVAEFEKTVTTKLEAISGKIDDLEVVDLTAIKADITTLNAKVANIDHVLAGNITAENIQTGAITAGSGIIAEGAIGDAQISSLSADKIRAGRIDTSLVTVASSDSVINITGNQLLINDTTSALQPFNRVTLGKYKVSENKWEYGLLVRSADGQTVMIDGNGVHNAGITNGAVDNNKVASDANIDGTKLNINSVVTQINKGTTKIQSTVVNVGNKTLEVYLAEQTETIEGQTETLAAHSSKISANEKAISLKVDSQTYSSDKADMTSKLNKTTSDLSVVQGQISSKVWQSDITTATNALKNTEIKSLSDRYATLNQTVDSIKGTVAQHTTEIAKKADGSTVSSLQSTVTNLSADLSGFKTSVSNTYTTKTDFNNLQIGGRNLLPNTKTFGDGWALPTGYDLNTTYNGFEVYHNKYTSSGSYKDLAFYKIPTTVEPSTEYTLSFYIKGTGKIYSYFFPSCVISGTTSQGTTSLSGDGSIACNVPSTWTRYWVTWKTMDDLTGDKNVIPCRQMGVDSEVYICGIKFEKGNKASDWSSAPEDVDSAINTVSEKVTSLGSSLDVVKGQISGKVWQTDITTAINSVKNNEIKTISDKYAQLDLKVDKFETTVSETYTTKTEFNNLAIGGRNIALSAGIISGGTTSFDKKDYVKSGTVTFGRGASQNGGIIFDKASIYEPSTKYVMRFKAKLNSGTIKNFFFHNGQGMKNTSVYIDGVRKGTYAQYPYINFTFTIGKYYEIVTYFETPSTLLDFTEGVQQTYWQPEKGGAYAYNVTITELKIEKGTKPTDWSPPPEDVNTSIETVSTTATQLSNKFDWVVKSGTSSSNFEITDRMATLTANYINLNGLVKFSGLASDAQSKVNTAYNTANSVNNTVNSNKANWDKGLTAYNWTNTNGSKATNLYNMVTKWTNGAVSGTTEINGGWVKTGTLTADKIAIGDFSNYAQLNENTLSKWGWTKVTDSSASNNPWFQKSTIERDSQISEWHTCNGGESFRVKANIYTTVKGASTSGGTDSSYRGIGIGVFSVNKDGTRNYQTSSRITNSTNGEISSVITLPSNAREFAVYIQIDGWNPFTGILRVRNVQVLRMSSGEMIVDGSITANMIKGKLLEGVTLKACNADITGGSINIVSGNESSSLIKLTDGQYATTKFNAWGMDVASGIYNTTTQVQSGGLFGRYNGTMMFGISSSTGYITCKNIDLPNVAITNASLELKSGRGTDVKLQSDWGLRFESSNWNSRMITWTNSTQGHDIQMGSDYVGGFRRWFVRDVTSNTICMSWDSDDNQLNIYPQIEAKGGVLNGSTEKLKTNIEKPDIDALDIINKSELYSYNLKSLYNQGITKKQFGFIIERECPDEIVSHNRQAVDTYSIAAIAWSGIKELNERFKDLEKTVADQQQTIGNLLENKNVVI